MILEVNKKYLNKQGDIVKIVTKVSDFCTDDNGIIYNKNCEAISLILIKNNENVYDLFKEYKDEL